MMPGGLANVSATSGASWAGGAFSRSSLRAPSFTTMRYGGSISSLRYVPANSASAAADGANGSARSSTWVGAPGGLTVTRVARPLVRSKVASIGAPVIATNRPPPSDLRGDGHPKCGVQPAILNHEPERLHLGAVPIQPGEGLELIGGDRHLRRVVRRRLGHRRRPEAHRPGTRRRRAAPEVSGFVDARLHSTATPNRCAGNRRNTARYPASAPPWLTVGTPR